MDYFSQGHLPLRKGRGLNPADDLTRVDQKSQTDWLKILFLGEAAVAIELSYLLSLGGA